MLQFMVEEGGASPAELPTLQRLCELLWECDERILPDTCSRPAGPTGTPSPPVPPPSASQPPVTPSAARPMLDLLLSPAVRAHGSAEETSFPSLALLARLLAGWEGNAAPTVSRAVVTATSYEPVLPPLPPPPGYACPQPPPPIPAEAEGEAVATDRDGTDASPSASDSTEAHVQEEKQEKITKGATLQLDSFPAPMAIPLPIVPGVGDWGGTRTVAVAPPPLPMAAAAPAEREEPGQMEAAAPPLLPPPESPSLSKRPLEGLTTADTSSEIAAAARTATASVAAALHKLSPPVTRAPKPSPAPSVAQPIPTPMVSLAPTASRSPSATTVATTVGATPTMRSRLIAGQLPRSVAAVLRQRQMAAAEGAPAFAPSANTPIGGRSTFIDRYMEKLYARTATAAATGTARTAPAANAGVSPTLQRSLRRASVDSRSKSHDAARPPSSSGGNRPSSRAPVDNTAVLAELHWPDATNAHQHHRASVSAAPVHRHASALPSGGTYEKMTSSAAAAAATPSAAYSPAIGFGAGHARYAYHQQLQQYLWLPRMRADSAARSRPRSSPLPELMEARRSGGPSTHAVRGSAGARKVRHPALQPGPTTKHQDGAAELAIVGRHIEIPSFAPHHPAGKYAS